MSDYDCSLYIHWPFCPYRCQYCPFVALAGQDYLMERYHVALKREIMQWAELSGRKKVKTLFFGGGTPSTYPINLLLDTFGTLRDVFDFDKVQEVTIEVNPGAVQPEHLALWRSAGINRISIGVQSTDEQVLKGLNRLQSSADLYWLLDACSRQFDSVSVDLMIGLPGISEKAWQSCLEQVVTWPIKHVSVYCLTVHEQTPFYYRILRNEIEMPSDDVIAQTYKSTVAFLQAKGFRHYEVSNFALPGFESIHNICYWERFPYQGFGLSACSFDGKGRMQNDSNLMNYIKKIENNQDITNFRECLTNDQVRLEKIMLGLRRAEGVSLETLFEGRTQETQQILKNKIACLAQMGFVNQTDGRICLTTAGFAVENEVITQLSA